MPRNLDLTPRPLPSWDWYAPDSTLAPAEYSRAIMANARRYAKAPETLPFNVATGEVRPMRQGYGKDGFVISLCYMSGTGWGGQSRESVATWEGGKRWTLTGLNRGKAGDALATLNLPEHDGRYLLRNAPPVPERGKAKWKARWTVARRELAGLTAVAGEGIDDSAVQRRMQTAIDAAKVRENIQRERFDAAIVQLAELPPMHDVAVRYGRLRARLLRWCNIGAENCDYNFVRQTIQARRQDTHTTRSVALVARAVELAWPYQHGHPYPLNYGVRMTRADGTPNHQRGPFTAAHEVGVPATAPDWNERKACGNGLHYIPFCDEEGRLRDLGACVSWAQSYGDLSDFALWIVRAGDARVMIDGQKAKAQTLTPCERVGSLVQNAQRTHPAILNTLVDFAEGARKREQLAHQREQAEQYAAEHAREVATLTAALREYRKARKA